MKISRIHKLYLIGFLDGLIFWYGIEKIFMTNIGITAAGVGIASAVFLIFNLIFDIPAGILADRWSLLVFLIVSTLGLGIGSVILGSSHGLSGYMIGEIFYGIYIVAKSGTYQAIIYDILYEEKRSEDYSKVIGKAMAFFLLGVGLANGASGFIAHAYSFQTAYYISAISCVLNVFVLLTLKEPTFHKLELKEKTVKQLSEVWNVIKQIKILRFLAVIMGFMAVVELFKSEFGQLLMLRYVSLPQLIGILMAIYAIFESIGSLIAHRFRNHLNLLILLCLLPYLLMSFIDAWPSIILFLVQCIAWGALLNMVGTLAQENTPSGIRASMLSTLSFISRAVAIPSSFFIGWMIYRYDVFWSVRFIGLIAFLMLIYWFANVGKLKKSLTTFRAVSD